MVIIAAIKFIVAIYLEKGDWMRVITETTINNLDTLMNQLEKYQNNYNKTKYEFETLLTLLDNGTKDRLQQAKEILDQNTEKLLLQTKTLTKFLKTEMSKLSELGNKINCKVESSDTMIFKINQIIEQIKTTYQAYQNMNALSFYPKKHLIINDQKKLQQQLETLEEERSIIKNKLETIQRVENEIEKEIANTKLTKIVFNTNLEQYKTTKKDTYYFHVEDVELSSKKITSYMKEQALLNENIENTISTLMQDYDSKNTSNINNLYNDILNSIKNIYQNISYYIRVIDNECYQARILTHKNLENLGG